MSFKQQKTEKQALARLDEILQIRTIAIVTDYTTYNTYKITLRIGTRSVATLAEYASSQKINVIYDFLKTKDPRVWLIMAEKSF